jgi:hypothetical protein
MSATPLPLVLNGLSRRRSARYNTAGTNPTVRLWHDPVFHRQAIFPNFSNMPNTMTYLIYVGLHYRFTEKLCSEVLYCAETFRELASRAVGNSESSRLVFEVK